MTTYKDLSGKFVMSVGSDPSAAVGEGEIWYNTSSNTFKTSIDVFAWSSGGAMGTARRQVGGFGHTQNTGVCFCGQNPPALSLTEEYDGTFW